MRKLVVWLALFLTLFTVFQGFGMVTVVAAAPPPWQPTGSLPIVHGVLFWSKSCPHCHEVIDNVLPPLQNKYGDRLDLRLFELSIPANSQLFEAALETFHVPLERSGVPFMIVDETVLVGSGEIPQQLPALIEKHLAAGGVGWPRVPGLAEVADTQVAAPSTPMGTPAQRSTPAVSMVVEDTPVPNATLPSQNIPAVSPSVVRAVMFWMNGCPHCEQVLAHVLPPLQEKYGKQVEIRLVEVATPQEIDDLYSMAAAFGLSKEQTGVPFLLIANQALVGSEQIPAELPGLIDRYLAAGGTEWPALANLEPSTTAPTSSPICVPTTTDCGAGTTISELPVQTTVRTDPAGFGLAIAVLLGMIVALFRTGKDVVTRRPGAPGSSSAWAIGGVPLLIVLGLGVAGYLSYVETQQVSAICGPIGHCNTVQQSPYARLFGVLPIGVLGALGYLAILGAWFVGQTGPAPFAGWARWSALAMAVFGVLFSLYLTLLEPFVIGAVCAWCLTSAVIMTVLMVLLTRPALERLRDEHP